VLANQDSSVPMCILIDDLAVRLEG
jgi:hypothetical protein